MVNQLRQRRERLGITQQALADLAGASRSMIRLLEQGYEPRRRSGVQRRVHRALAELEAATGQPSGSAAEVTRKPGRQTPGTNSPRAARERLLHERPVDRERAE